MKKLLLRLGLLTALTLAMFSCDKQDQHQNLIPKDADLVFTLQPAQIAEKANLSSEENIKMLEKLVEKSGNEEVSAQLIKLIKHPEESGIDVKAPVYCFMNLPKEGQSEGLFALSLKLKSADDFRDVFRKLDPEKTFEEGEVAGFQTLKTAKDDTFIIATKDNEGLLLGGDSSELNAKLKAILEQKEADSFASTKLFAKVKEAKDDFSCVMNCGTLLDNASIFKHMPRQQRAMLDASTKDFPLDEAYYIFGLNAEKGALKLSTESYSENEKVQEMFEKTEDLFPKSDDEFLKLLPKNSLFTFNLSVDGAKCWDFMNEYHPSLAEKLQEATKEELDKLGVSLEECVKSFDGDIAFSLAGSMNDFMQSRADMRLFAELDKTDVAVKLINLLVEENKRSINFHKLGDNQYSFRDFRNPISLPARFGLKDDVFFLSTQPVDNVDALFEATQPNIKESRFADKITGKRVSIVYNLSDIISLAKPFMSMGLSADVISLLEEMDYLSMTNTDEITKTETTLKLKNDKNPYALLLDLARGLVK